MGFRFRKSISLGKGSRLNIGKKGLGLSTGTKGARVGIGSKGAYTSFSIPGTGLHSVNYLGPGSQSVDKSSTNSDTSIDVGICGVLILGVILLILIIALPVVGWPLLILSIIAYIYWYRQPKQQARRKLAKAKDFFKQQNYKEAIELLQDAEKFDDSNNDVMRLLGGAFHNSKKYSKAIKYLKKYLSTNQTDLYSWLVLANCYYKTKKFKKAIDILQKMPGDFKQDFKVIQLLGACFAKQKKYDLAIDVFKKAPLLKRNLDNDLMEVHYNLALVYEESGDKENALKHFKKVYAQDVGYHDVAKKIKSLEK